MYNGRFQHKLVFDDKRRREAEDAAEEASRQSTVSALRQHCVSTASAL